MLVRKLSVPVWSTILVMHVAFPGLLQAPGIPHGWDAIDPATNLGIPDRNELDLWLQYRPTEGRLKGFRFKTQYTNVWQDGNVRDAQPEFRFIVDYTVLSVLQSNKPRAKHALLQHT